jgi:hypothetical protein
VISAQLVDPLWPIFLLLHIEHARIALYSPGDISGKYFQPSTTVDIAYRNCRECRIAPCADGILDQQAPDIARMSLSV